MFFLFLPHIPLQCPASKATSLTQDTQTFGKQPHSQATQTYRPWMQPRSRHVHILLDKISQYVSSSRFYLPCNPVLHAIKSHCVTHTIRILNSVTRKAGGLERSVIRSSTCPNALHIEKNEPNTRNGCESSDNIHVYGSLWT